MDGETFTQRCRRLLDDQPEQGEFTVSRAGLECLVLDSERYGESNKAANALLLEARQLASDTVMNKDDEREWLSGGRDHLLPQMMRSLAYGHKRLIGVGA